MTSTRSARSTTLPATLGVLLCVATAAVSTAHPGDDEPPRAAAAEAPAAEPWWDLADASISRKEIRERLVAFLGRAGELGTFGERGTWMHGWIAVLDRMIAEDAAHVAPAGPLHELPAHERIAELIFRLRDVTGATVFANGGPPPIFAMEGLQAPNAADLLVREGHAAVPALIATLGDERLTRCVGDPRGAGNPMVTRVGEAALQILARMAGRSFPPAHEPGSQPSRDFGASSRAPVTAWLEAVQEKGEFLATADELDSTTVPYMDVQLAKRLAALDPNAAGPFVVRITRGHADPLRRKLLLDVLDGLHGPGVTEFLRRELAHGPYLLHRVAAAYSLRERGGADRARALEAVREAWRGPLDYGKSGNPQHDGWTVSAGAHQIAAFLASSGDPDVVADLGRGLAERPPLARAMAAQVFAPEATGMFLMGYLGRYRFLEGIPDVPEAVARTVLGGLLDDTTAVPHDARPGAAPEDVRVADVAAYVLSRRDPARFAFTIGAPVSARDSAIARIREALTEVR